MIFDQIQPFPQEITMAEYKSTFAALSLVCRLFCVECQPRVFADYLYDGKSTNHELKKKRKVWGYQLTPANRKDPRSAMLASFVREATYVDELPSGPHSSSGYSTRFDDDLSMATKHFSNLATITLRRCLIQSSTFSALREMPNLRTVVLDGCQNRESYHSNYIVNPRPKWTSFTTVKSYDMTLWIPFIVAYIDIQNLVHFSSDDWRLTSALLEEQSAPKLKKLEMHALAEEAHEIPGILQNTPNLTSLALMTNGGHGLEPLAADIVPRLTALTAGEVTASYLLPNHPVSFLDIRHPQPVGAEFRPFEESWAPWISAVRELVMPTKHMARLQSDHFPLLHTLTLEPRCASRMPTTSTFIVSVLARFSKGTAHRVHYNPLQDSARFAKQAPFLPPTTIVYNMHTKCARCTRALFKLRSQRSELIAPMASAYPNARCIRVGEVVEWRRVTGAEDWRPRVVSRPLVRQLLMDRARNPKSPVMDVQDVDGCLASVFTEDEFAEVNARWRRELLDLP